MTRILNIISVMIIIGLFGFFWFFYTPAALGKAEMKYNAQKKELESCNEKLEREIATMKKAQTEMERKLNLEKEKRSQLEKELSNTKRLLEKCKRNAMDLVPDAHLNIICSYGPTNRASAPRTWCQMLILI